MTILAMLRDGIDRGRIVEFTMSDDKRTVNVSECCDNYFATDLTKAEFGLMIAELQALHAQMEDGIEPQPNRQESK